MYALMFNNWIEDINEENKRSQDLAYLIGSFINPEMVKRILGTDADTYQSDDEEFEEFSKKLLEQNKIIKKRKRKSKLKA